MQRLSRIETAVIAVGIDNTRRLNLETGPIPDDRASQTQQLGRAMLTRTQVLNNLARYDGQLAPPFFPRRRVDDQHPPRRPPTPRSLRSQNAGATTPVHYLPDEDPSSTHPSAIGFRPAEKLASGSSADDPQRKIGDCPKRRPKRLQSNPNPSPARSDCPPFFPVGRSPGLPSDQPKTARVCEKEGPASPQNQEPRNEAKTDLTPACTASYK